MRVPVLSKVTMSTLWAVSRASADLIRMPCSAPFPVPTMMATGVARPRAQGQDTTRTAIPVLMANSAPAPASSQAMAATRAMAMTQGTNTPATLSASLAMGALLPAASSTRRIMADRVVSSPTCSARKRRLPLPLTQPARTLSPGCL